MSKYFASTAAVGLLAFFPGQAWAQDLDAPVDSGAVEAATPEQAELERAGVRSFTPADFAQFSPRNALDMISQIPGFTLNEVDGGRGLGQASANVLIDGERVTSKSDGVSSQLQRIVAGRVERIEIVDGATLGIAGLSGQVANVITRPTAISGRYSYRASFRPRYAEPSYLGGEVSVSGSSTDLEWTLAASNGVGRGAAGGGEAFLFDAAGNVREVRDVRIRFVGDFPRVSGSLRWTGSDGTVVNVNGNYRRNYQSFRDNEYRDLTTGVDRLRAFENRDHGWGYELGGDVEFGLAGGRFKLIGIDRYSRGRSRSDSILVFDDNRPDEGSRFAALTSTGERIVRGEYRWNMLGGDWQLDGEGAFNRLNRSAQLFSLNPTGSFVELPFPNGTGGVTEDRYETILTHSRSLAANLTLQLGLGGEYSTLAQSGPSGLTRSFLRPKGSLNLAWQVEPGFDLSLELARRVGQLDFGDFLATVSLNQGQQNAGNVRLVPEQSWEARIEATKSLGPWGSSTLRLYAREVEDYIEFIPVPGGLETRGNIDSASLVGLRWNSTFQLAQVGFNGAKLDVTVVLEDSNVEDPLTGEQRSWDSHTSRAIEAELRHDVPGSDWAWGVGLNYNHVLPYYRLGETGRNYEGPLYTYAFLEHKDVFGMTANLSVFNLTDGRAREDRFVYDGYRDRSPLLFRETQNLSVQPIFNFRLTGNF